MRDFKAEKQIDLQKIAGSLVALQGSAEVGHLVERKEGQIDPKKVLLLRRIRIAAERSRIGLRSIG